MYLFYLFLYFVDEDWLLQVINRDQFLTWTGRRRRRKMRRLLALTLMGALVLVIIVTALSVWSWRGGEEGYYNSTTSVTETEAQPVDLEFMPSNGDDKFMTTEVVVTETVTEVVTETTTSTAKVTRTPCRTRTGARCKSWIYFGQTISGWAFKSINLI